MDIVGTFLVEIKGKRTDQTDEDTAVVYVRTQGRSVIKDDEGKQFFFPAVSAGHKGESISLPHTLELPTDVTTGQSTELGYTVTVTTRYEGSVTYNFAARAASATKISLTDLGEDIITPVSDAVAFVTAAQAAAADAEDHEIAAEAAAAEAAAFAGTNNTQVAGMVTGTGPTKDALSATYARGASPATQGFLNRLRVGREDAVLAVLGDSTGNANDEWFYLLGQWLGTQFPAYTVRHRLWNDTSQSYDAPTTVQTGTGSQFLDLYNGSTPGMAAAYSQTRVATQLPVAPDVVCISYGHNSIGDVDYAPDEYQLARTVVRKWPQSSIVLVAQNPRGDAENASQQIRMRQVVSVAASEGWGLINATDAFLDDPAYVTNLLNVDGIHPNPTGSQLWANVAKAAFTRDRRAPVSRGARADSRLWLPAQQFNAIQWGAAAPPALTSLNNQIAVMTMTKPGGLDTLKVATHVHVPDHWDSWDVTFYWTTNDTAAGNVAWTIDHVPLTTGAVLTRSTDAPKGAPAPGVALQLQAYRFYAGWAGPAGSPHDFQLTVGRVPGNAADTYAAAAYLLGIALDRAS